MATDFSNEGEGQINFNIYIKENTNNIFINTNNIDKTSPKNEVIQSGAPNKNNEQLYQVPETGELQNNMLERKLVDDLNIGDFCSK